MIMFFMMLSLISSMTLICLTHPISMGSILLMQTIVITLTIGFFHTNFWYSYILFLIMVSGMLVLFAYMTSVASNEKFSPSIKIFLMVLIIITMFMFLMMMMDPYYTNLNNVFSDNLNNTINYNISMNKYFNYPNMFIMLMLIIYLLITLIAVVKITKIKMGPLRQTH
uniref:NADH dehydrogenase subunit 6 n=1 Tax=Eupatorus hardwickei TaxID=2950138 RepID=UPI0021B51AF6|nr:NADH dehydrogenase subunit 6 [Eupatorus hardwickei]UWI70890.1 NADH dehydrogenase subunit 6 [Eupatorus hardwickei]